MNRFQRLTAFAALLLASGAATAACVLSPLHTILSEGDTAQLTATCDDAGVFDSVDWKKDGVTVLGGAMTVTIGTPTTNRVYTYRTPSSLVPGSYLYTMTGMTGSTPTDTGQARVVVRGGLTQSLTVTKSPVAGGTVAQMTTGTKLIDCGATCSATLDRNATLTLTATPAFGYVFTGWSGACTGTGTCTVNMASSQSVTANFDNTTPACGTANATVLHDLPGDAQACTTGALSGSATTATAFHWNCGSTSCQAARGYNVTASDDDANGTLSPVGVTLVQAGRTKKFSLAPNTGYGAATGGTCGGTQSGITSYTTNPVTADCTVVAAFPAEVTVTGTAGANGTISPASRTVAPGLTTTFTVTPNSGYTASATGCGGSLSGTTYTTGVITGACTVSATFTSTTPSYTVTATDNGSANGDITPSSRTVTQGQTTTFTVTANSGYVPSVSGCGGTLSGTASPYTYTTGAITAACTVTASFALNASPATDPGYGSNQLWIPPSAVASPVSASTLVVADHSGSPPHPQASYLPGCINGGVASTYGSACGANTSYTATPVGLASEYTVNMAQGRTLSLRYRPNTGAGASLKSVRLEAADGSLTLAGTVSLWITTDPTQTYEAASSVCKKQANTNLTVITGPSFCPLSDTVPIYYINIRSEFNCPTCRYQLNTNQDDFQ